MTRSSNQGWPDELQPPRQLSTRVVYESQWLRLREDEIERADGTRGIYSVIEKPDFALIIPFENDGFHLVEQYRYPARGRYWEFPQGTLSGGRNADPEEVARVELAEETGLRAGRLEQIGRLFTGYGTSSQGCNVFLATQLSPGPPRPETEEGDMRNVWVPRPEFEESVRTGVIVDGATIAAYGLLILGSHH